MRSLGDRPANLAMASVVLVGSLCLYAGMTSAQQPPKLPEPSSQAGKALAERACSSCHLLPGATVSSVPTGTPTFRGIANKPGQSGDDIANVLMKPHAPMPDLQLSRQDILDITAYLEELRTDTSVPPLIAPPAGSKPKFPSPS